MGEVAEDSVSIWFVDITNELGIVGLEIRRGNIDITLGVGILGRRIELMFPWNVNEAVGIEVGVVLVGVGMFVGVVGMFVGVVGVGVMTGDGFIGAGMVPIDRRARPSSGSTEIDAFLLDRRALARRWLCSWCGFIFFPPHVTVGN